MRNKLSPDPGKAPRWHGTDLRKRLCRWQGKEQEREPALGQISRPRFENQLLATLSNEALSALRPRLEHLSLERGAVLSAANDSTRRVYFVESGLVSLVTENRAPVVVATVGREGSVGGPTLLLGGAIVFGRYQMLTSGAAVAMEASTFRIALRENPKFRSLCEAYTQAFFIQVLENLACSRLHSAEQRCARWLLLCDDQTGDDSFELAQDSLSALLRVPQSVADTVVSGLRLAGLIRLRQGLITIRDRLKLEAAACVCYRRLHDHYERLLARTCVSASESEPDLRRDPV
jgi:CRP-like cAMP-binding protein